MLLFLRNYRKVDVVKVESQIEEGRKIIDENLEKYFQDEVSKSENYWEKKIKEFKKENTSILNDLSINSSLKNIIKNKKDFDHYETHLISKIGKNNSNIDIKKLTHFNILVTGKSGVGKSTLINKVLNLPMNEGAKTGFGEPVTVDIGKKDNMFESNSVEYLRMFDTRGIELGKYDSEKAFKYSEELIQRRKKLKPDEYIHCIWYCICDTRFQEVEKEFYEKLMNSYRETIPIIFIYTRSVSDEDYNKMKNFLKKGKYTNELIRVLAFDYNSNGVSIKAFGIDDLITATGNRLKEAIESAFYEYIQEIIYPKLLKIYEKEKKNKIESLNEEINNYFEILDEDDLTKIFDDILKVTKKYIDIFIDLKEIDEESLIKNVTDYINEKTQKFIEKFKIDYEAEILSKAKKIIEDVENKYNFCNLYPNNRFMEKYADIYSFLPKIKEKTQINLFEAYFKEILKEIIKYLNINLDEFIKNLKSSKIFEKFVKQKAVDFYERNDDEIISKIKSKINY